MSANPAHIARIARRIDFSGIALLVISAGLYIRAYLGMGTLRANGGSLSKARYAGLAEFDGYWKLSRYAIWIGMFAMLVLVVGAIFTWRAKRAAALAPSEAVPAV